MQFVEYLTESEKQEGCKCIGCLSSWSRGCLGGIVGLIPRPGKDQNSKCKVYWIMYHFRTVIKSNHPKLNHH